MATTDETRLALTALPSVLSALPNGVNKHVYAALRMNEESGLSTLSDPATAFPVPKRRRVTCDGWDEGNVYLARQINVLAVARSSIVQLASEHARALANTGLASLHGPSAASTSAAAALVSSNGDASNVPFITLSAGDISHRVYVGNLDPIVTESDLIAILSATIGPIVKLDMPRDHMGISKTFAFVDFLHQSDVNRAISELNGYIIANRPIRVSPPRSTLQNQAPISATGAAAAAAGVPLYVITPSAAAAVEHGPAPGAAAPTASSSASAAAAAAAGAGASEVPPDCRCFIACVAPEFTEEHLSAIFAAFGVVRKVMLLVDPATGKKRAHGFVEYSTPEAAADAIAQLNGQKLGSRNIVVRPANTRTTSAPAPVPVTVPVPPSGVDAGPGAGAGSYTPSAAVQQQQQQQQQQHVVQELGDSGAATIVCLRNMLTTTDLSEATVPELKDETAIECAKHGTIRAIEITHPNPSAQALEVWVCYTTAEEAGRAQQALEGKHFADTKIKASLERSVIGTPLR